MRTIVAGPLRHLGRRPIVTVCALGALLFLAWVFRLESSPADGSLSATVTRGDLVLHIAETGALKAADSMTYRSPLAGREAELTFLAPEGITVNEGDLLIRLETSELELELERARQQLRQSELEVRVAEGDRDEASAALESLLDGEGAISLEESELSLKSAEQQAARLRSETEDLTALLQHGYITKDELDRSSTELQQAEAALKLARRRNDLLVNKTHPRERQRAELTLERRHAQIADAREKARESALRVTSIQEAIRSGSVYARSAGLVLYEENALTSPRRKVHVGDRVTPSQGLITIPSATRMQVELSVRESDLARVRAGQPATVHVDAFPELELPGRVAVVGSLARASAERVFGDKRFDVTLDVLDVNANLRPEMSVRVDIQVGQRKDVLRAPINGVFDHGGVFVAYVNQPWGIETRRIDVGAASDLFVEIRSGLKEGESLHLTDISPGALR